MLGVDPDRICGRLQGEIEAVLLPEMRKVSAQADITSDMIFDYPAHTIEPDAPLVAAMQVVLGTNSLTKVDYGTEV